MTAATDSRTYNSFQLASMADVAAPDALNSPGGDWLDTVYLSTLELIEDYTDDDERMDAIHERADSLVPVHTHDRWKVLLDLAAYNEDVAELGDTGEDLTESAGVALWMVAERLIAAVIEDHDDQEDDEEE